MRIFGIGSLIVIFTWFLGFFYFLKITEEELAINRSITDAIIVVGQKKQNLKMKNLIFNKNEIKIY